MCDYWTRRNLKKQKALTKLVNAFLINKKRPWYGLFNKIHASRLRSRHSTHFKTWLNPER